MDRKAVDARREAFFEATRRELRKYVNEEDGSGRIPQLNPPYREPVWVLPALYTGSAADIALANRMVERYHDAPPQYYQGIGGVGSGKKFNIFQSNLFAGLLFEYDRLLTPKAREVMEWQTRQVFKTFEGSAQADFRFRGANDNMPMMATKGLILGGEKLKNEWAYRHGVWNLNEFRRLLCRAGWASEFNSSTYSAVTLASLAKIAELASDPEVRQVALDCESRMWAELLLHFHPGTRLSAGPQSRAYEIDYAGHTHSLQIIFWLMFGPELSGRDPLQSYFQPDGTEVMHFEGCYFQSVCEYCDMIDAHFHLPPELEFLASGRKYPARLKGRAEAMGRYQGCCGEYATTTYMEEAFSLGSCDQPLGGGEQTAQLYATYKRKPEVKSYRDSASIFYKYFLGREPVGARDRSADGNFSGERFLSNRAWCYTLQQDNTALLLSIPNLNNAPVTTDKLALNVFFPSHYGKIARSVIGDGPVLEGAQGESAEVAPVSIEAGEVYIHIRPLIPTSLPRRAAVRFTSYPGYEVLELVNFETFGERKFVFDAKALELVLNGMIFTIDDKAKWASLEEFHRVHSEVVILDYYDSGHRYFHSVGHGVEFEVVYTPSQFGVQTRAINGRTVPTPIMESNQLEVEKLPLMRGPVAPQQFFFPWRDSLEMCYYPVDRWIIGSRGLPGEPPYSRRVEDRKLFPPA